MICSLCVFAQPQTTTDSTIRPLTLTQTFEDLEQERPEGAVSPAIKNTVLVATGVGLWTTTFLFMDEPIQRFSQRYRSNASEQVAGVVEPLGRQKYLMPAAGAVFASGLILKDEKLQKAGVVSIGSILVNAAATSTLKRAFGRHRPDVATENNKFDGPFRASDHDAFPSSHTSMAFTVATSVALAYKDSKYIPPIAYGLATLVGLSRIHDNVHWTTDVMKGAMVGYLSAKGVNYLYDLANQKLKNRKRNLLIAPIVSPKSASLSVTLVY